MITKLINRPSPALNSSVLILGLVGALTLRVVIAGSNGSRSASAGILFGAMLLAICLSYSRINLKFKLKYLFIGLMGAGVLIFPVMLNRLGNIEAYPQGNYLAWSSVIVFVACVEEAFFRGVMYCSIKKWKGTFLAILISTVVFAAVHVPFYGWHSLAINLIAGSWFGVLRYVSGSFTSSAIAHSLADLAGWWLI